MDNLEKLKKMVFAGFLSEDNFYNLEKEGISVKVGDNLKLVNRLDETSFSPRILCKATKMASIFISFFCLENSIRELIKERLSERIGIDWWEKSVPQNVQKRAETLMVKEKKNKYHSARATDFIGYTLFGDLGLIIINNWEHFSDLIPDQSWVNARFNDLELSRNIIMHTGVLPDLEIDRIDSITRDWIRQVS